MERDCLLGNGVASVIRDRFCEQSDKYECWVCNVCGIIATYNAETGEKNCAICKIDGDDITKIQIPYTTKLLFQELMALCIAPRIMTSQFKKNEINK